MPELAVAAGDGRRTRVRDIRRFWHRVQAPPSLLKRLEPAYYVFITLAIGGPFVYGTASAALSEVATPRAVGIWGPSLALVALVHGVADDENEERIDTLLARLGLAHRADFLPAELSRGLKQKTGLACALIRPAKLLVLDEPVVGLDPPSQALLVELLLEAKASGTAVLLTTHQMAFADGVADRAILLSEGEVLDQGPWAAVRKRAAERGWLPADA